ncbi:glycosyl hydrolase family 17 protein [Thalassotalea fonticola]|uniref:Endo-1,3-beta-glucanase btgC n=1 Tax=Thalassotalea fonticola TaxID=3065649 RepID=A0ABZ0GP56_9GAMM|nr:glycosyl hydrolase family 17 protein [Colwelliaceae bacterium S1-1]
MSRQYHHRLQSQGKGSNYSHRMVLSGLDLSGLGEVELNTVVRKILADKIHGISFSPYIAGQGPGTIISEAQIRERLSIIQPYVNSVRSFSCTDGNELIPAIAKKNGLDTMVGVWLSDDLDKNEEELANGIAVANAGHADILAIGNEVLLREDLTEDQLVDYLNRAKVACPNVEVGYVDAYYKFVNYPRVTEACDVILANCYPFWEGCPAEYALPYMKEMYKQAKCAANGKRVVISETGWPDRGSPFEGSQPGYENAVKYFINAYKWAEEEGIDIFYFSSFDEDWKVASEGDVGAYWGLWDKEGILKYT